MKKLILALALMVTVGCVQNRETTTAPIKEGNPRFEFVSQTFIGNSTGSIVVFRDTVVNQCMASYLYQGVMSWAVPCDKADYDAQMERQMQRMMQQMMQQAPSRYDPEMMQRAGQ